MLFHADEGIWPFQAGEDISDALNFYLDWPMLRGQYHVAEMALEGQDILIGLTPRVRNIQDKNRWVSIREKLASRAKSAGLRDADGGEYKSDKGDVFVVESDNGRR